MQAPSPGSPEAIGQIDVGACMLLTLAFLGPYGKAATAWRFNDLTVPRTPVSDAEALERERARRLSTQVGLSTPTLRSRSSRRLRPRGARTSRLLRFSEIAHGSGRRSAKDRPKESCSS